MQHIAHRHSDEIAKLNAEIERLRTELTSYKVSSHIFDTEFQALHSLNADLCEALKPLARHADYLESFFTPEELAEIDQEHHLVAHGITVADCFIARAALARAQSTAAEASP
jgi:hypothetical protein